MSGTRKSEGWLAPYPSVPGTFFLPEVNVHVPGQDRLCSYHRAGLGEPFILPPELVVPDEAPGEQVNRLCRLVHRCSHNGYRLANHSYDVMTLSARLARFVGFDLGQIQVVRIGGFLHDVGKVFTCLDTLLSPKLGLGDAEWLEVMRHPAEGAALVTHPELGAVRTLIGCHHEWPGNRGPDAGGFSYPEGLSHTEIAAVARGGHAIYGRRGYPNQLRRGELPEEVLLLSVCDWYAGCAERRLYREAQVHDVAMRWTEEAAALGKIDPQFTMTLGRMLAERPWHPCTAAVEPAAAVVP